MVAAEGPAVVSVVDDDVVVEELAVETGDPCVEAVGEDCEGG